MSTRPQQGRVGAGPVWAAIYAAAAVALALAAGYLHFGRGMAPLTPHVLAPAIGALWFCLRAVMAHLHRSS